MRVYRQGDIVLRERKQGLGIHKVLSENSLKMRGETGKDHTIKAQKIIQSLNGSTQVLVEQEGTIEHEEHASIKLSGGIYDADRVRTWQEQGGPQGVAE